MKHHQGGHSTGKMEFGCQFFPDRENRGNLATTQGKN